MTTQARPLPAQYNAHCPVCRGLVALVRTTRLDAEYWRGVCQSCGATVTLLAHPKREQTQ